MSQQSSDSSTSESEISHCSSNFDPIKTLYSPKTKIPVKKAPLYDNIQQYESSFKKNSSIIPIGYSELVKQREEEKERLKLEEERKVLELNKQRFAKYEGLVPTTGRDKRRKNVLTRIEAMEGPLAALKDCVDKRLRVKVITRNECRVRGALHGTLVAFDKQWNLALTDVLEIWRRKAPNKRKIPPCLGNPVPKGTAATISPVPVVTETPVGKGIWECTRHLPQLLVRGEHVVLLNIVER